VELSVPLALVKRVDADGSAPEPSVGIDPGESLANVGAMLAMEEPWEAELPCSVSVLEAVGSLVKVVTNVAGVDGRAIVVVPVVAVVVAVVVVVVVVVEAGVVNRADSLSPAAINERKKKGKYSTTIQ
jgi:hypothetical protein